MMTPALMMAAALCLALVGVAEATVAEGELLLNLSANITNWDAATASVPGAAWEAGTDPCGGNGAEGWKGVTCSEGNVTELRLPGLGLNGQLPAQLAQLQSLEVVDMSNNAMTGVAPLGWLDPSWITPQAFPSLAVLNLGANNISGCLDAVTKVHTGGGLDIISNQQLNLSSNKLMLSLPAFWQSPTMELLDLSHNQLTSTLPQQWDQRVTRDQLSAFPSLALLNLSHNNLTGTVPQNWTAPNTFAANATIILFPNQGLSATSDSSSGSGKNTGLIVGVAVGATVVVVLLVGVALLFWRRRCRGARTLGQQFMVAAAPGSTNSSFKGQPDDLEKNTGKPPQSPHSSLDSAAGGGGGKGSFFRLRIGDVAGSGSTSSSLQSSSRFSDDTAGRMPIARSGRPGSDQLSEASSTDMSKLPSDWSTVRFSELELGRVIGEGSFGQVWLARYCQTTVAVKLLNQTKVPGATDSAAERSVLRQLQKEAGLMSLMRHPNVVSYFGACLDPPCLIMEFASKKSVDCVLSQGLECGKVRKQLSWARLLSMAADAAKGMLYLHTRSPAIAHRDLKSANLLIDGQWHVKVADFNLSRQVEQGHLMSTLCITNPRWLGPEVLAGGLSDCASDVYAFGTVLWELATWQAPFHGMNPFQIINAVQAAAAAGAGAGLPIPAAEELPAGPFEGYPQYLQLMKSCWGADPSQRPNMESVATQLRVLLSAELRSVSVGGDALSGSQALPGSGAVAPGGSRSRQASGPLEMLPEDGPGAATPPAAEEPPGFPPSAFATVP